jgi:Fe-S cluster assembly protein SufD
MSAVLNRGPAPALERVRALFEQQRDILPAPLLSGAKHAALEQFLAHGYPSQTEEHWKYTNLRRLTNRTFELPLRAPAVSATALPGIEAADWQRIVFVDGHYLQSLSTPQSPNGGLTIRSLAQLLRNDPSEAARVLDTSSGLELHPFASLNAALTQDGVVIDCAAGADITTPLYLIFTHSAERPWMTHPQITVRMAANSRLQLIEHHIGSTGEYCTNAVTRVQLSDGAKLTHYRLQQESSKAFHIGLVTADISRDASFVSHTLASGASLGRTDLNIRLRAPGARTELHGLFLAASDQHLDTYTRIEHLAPHTESIEDYRGIATDRGRGVFNGKIIVHKDAQKIQSAQSSRNLLLSNTAEIDTRPELEIYADDVKCSHGATTGQLDANALFYLRSRGMEEDEARRVLTVAFAEVVLAQMSLTPVREYIEQVLLTPLAAPVVTPTGTAS